MQKPRTSLSLGKKKTFDFYCFVFIILSIESNIRAMLLVVFLRFQVSILPRQRRSQTTEVQGLRSSVFMLTPYTA